jgi:hypothetical protein
MNDHKPGKYACQVVTLHIVAMSVETNDCSVGMSYRVGSTPSAATPGRGRSIETLTLPRRWLA